MRPHCPQSPQRCQSRKSGQRGAPEHWPSSKFTVWLLHSSHSNSPAAQSISPVKGVYAGGPGSILGQRTKIPPALRRSKKKKNSYKTTVQKKKITVQVQVFPLSNECFFFFFCSRERFIAKPFKETGSLCLKSPELPEGFPQSTFKNQMVGGGLRSACHNSLIGWQWGWCHRG